MLRPAIPNDEMFGTDGTYGPKANFKISTRELPDEGRFRITVMAAKYDDGLMLDAGAKARESGDADAMTVSDPATPQTVTIPKAGVYQVDIYSPAAKAPVSPDARISPMVFPVSGSWMARVLAPERCGQSAIFVDSPFGKGGRLR